MIQEIEMKYDVTSQAYRDSLLSKRKSNDNV